MQSRRLRPVPQGHVLRVWPACQPGAGQRAAGEPLHLSLRGRPVQRVETTVSPHSDVMSHIVARSCPDCVAMPERSHMTSRAQRTWFRTLSSAQSRSAQHSTIVRPFPRGCIGSCTTWRWMAHAVERKSRPTSSATGAIGWRCCGAMTPTPSTRRWSSSGPRLVSSSRTHCCASRSSTAARWSCTTRKVFPCPQWRTSNRLACLQPSSDCDGDA